MSDLIETHTGPLLNVAGLSHAERARFGLSHAGSIRELGVDGPITLKQIVPVVEYAKSLPVCGFDTETTGFDPFLDRIILVQVGDPHRQYLIWWHQMTAEAKEYFRTEFYTNAEIPKVGFNLKYDAKMIAGNEGMHWRMARPVDCSLFEQILHCGLTGDIGQTLLMTSMGWTARRWLGWDMPKDEETRTGWEKITPGKWESELHQRQRLYAADDVCVPVHLIQIQVAWIHQLELEDAIRLELDFLPELTDMELRGMGFNWEKWKVLAAEAQTKLEAAEVALDELFDVTVTYTVDMEDNIVVSRDKNYGSPEEIRDLINQWMWDEYGIDVIMTNRQMKAALIRSGLNPDFVEKQFPQKLMPHKQKEGKNKQVGYPGMNDYLVGSEYVKSKWELYKDRLSENAFLCESTDSKLLQLMRILHEAPDDEIDPSMPTTVGLPPRLIDPLLEFREYRTKMSRYAYSWEKLIHPLTKRVYTNATQCAADTTRLTMTPNLNNIDADPRYRECFEEANPEEEEDPFMIVAADFSQIEPRIIAQISQCRAYMRIFWSEKPGTAGFKYWCGNDVTEPLDLYGAIGAGIGVLPKDAEKKSIAKLERNAGGRKKSKIAVLGLGYGTGQPKFHVQYMRDMKKYAPRHESDSLFNNFWSLAHEVKDTLDELSALADPKKSHRTVYHPFIKDHVTYSVSLAGQKRFFAPHSKRWWTQGRNHGIQCLGAVLLKRTVIELGKLYRSQGWEGGVIMTAHDEVLCRIRKSVAEALRVQMEKIMARVGREYCPKVPISASATVSSHWIKD